VESFFPIRSSTFMMSSHQEFSKTLKNSKIRSAGGIRRPAGVRPFWQNNCNHCIVALLTELCGGSLPGYPAINLPF